MHVFATTRNIEQLCQSPVWFLDRTFKKSPGINVHSDKWLRKNGCRNITHSDNWPSQKLFRKSVPELNEDAVNGSVGNEVAVEAGAWFDPDDSNTFIPPFQISALF